MTFAADHRTHNATGVILLTGFDPFGGGTLTPGWLVAKALKGQRIAGHRVVAAQLSTIFGKSLQQLEALTTIHWPALILCRASQGDAMRFPWSEWASTSTMPAFPTTQATSPSTRRWCPAVRRSGGPAAYFTSLPVKAMLQAVLRSGVPCEVSQTTGTFVCNHVPYGLLRLLQTQGAGATH